MSNKHVRLLAVAVLCLSRGAWGQTSEADSVRGELHSSTILRGQITLTDLHGGNALAAPIGGDGRFEFHHVPYGEYRLAVLTSDERPVYQELVSVHAQQQPIALDVAAPQEPRPPVGPVSAQELLHPPAKKAFQALAAAQKFSEAGDHQKAAGQLEKAVQLSPDYTSAWINLGAQHIYLKRYEEAIQDLTRASETSKPTAMILSNLAFAQYMLRRDAEATASVRAALRVDPAWAAAHYLLGSFLAQNRQTRVEGVQHLEVAARTMSAARAELERLERESVQVVTHP